MQHPLSALLLIATLFTTGCGDSSPLSGGALVGTEVQIPSDWTAIAADDVVQLETNPTDPYSVNLWVIGAGSKLYVYRGTSEATWVDHIKSNPNVRIQIGDQVYPLQAQRVTDEGEFQAFADAWLAKYDSDRPQSTNAGEAYLFRLEPRS